MPDLAGTLKEEIRRLARKEVKSETESARQAIAQYRRDIAELKRQVADQQKRVAYLEKRERERIETPQADVESLEGARFSPRSVRSQRERIGFSQADYAKLVGVSPMTIYNWEQGKSRPRQEQLAALVALRGIGKRDAMKRLELLGDGS